MSMTTEAAVSTPWALVPSVERSYINSEQDKDRERALAYCQAHNLDYQEARRIIVLEMVRDYDANEPARAKRRKGIKT